MSVATVELRMAAVRIELRRHRYSYASEVELHDRLAAVLQAAGYPVRREVRLSDRDRIDLLVGDVGIEVKVKGARTPLRQLRRYAEHEAVAGLLLVTTRAAALPAELNGKPLQLVSLLTNGL